ncbi:MAG: MAPEG family protein [Chloroflexaceae bacterium]|nr:MAPEG family protein [Chloroflexaceae bacterium]
MAISSSSVLPIAIAAAAVLIYLPFLAVAVARAQVGYDISAPRALFDKLPPYAQRATWAHQNAFESFTIFVPAALMAYFMGVEGQWVTGAAISYVVARVLYPFCYIFDLPWARSLTFGLGTAASLTLYGLSLLTLKQTL